MKPKIKTKFETRPEAIKMATVAQKIQAEKCFKLKICNTGQHDEMLRQVQSIFNLKINYNLSTLKKNQSLEKLYANIILKFKDVIDDYKPDLVLIHGDTASTFAVAWCCFLNNIEVAHVEAGLRTRDIFSPFPEEANRKLTSCIASLHYAPTKLARQNLIDEGYRKSQIIVTGNTVVDALKFILQKVSSRKFNDVFKNQLKADIEAKKIILVTCHRRENFGENINYLCNELKRLSKLNNIHIVIPVHPNPKVSKIIKKNLAIENISLIAPLDYEKFIYLMSKSSLIISDSGGIQEEAPSLKKDVILFRESTERPEAFESGVVHISKPSKKNLYKLAIKLLSNDETKKVHNPFGDGKASQRILKSIKRFFRVNIS